MFGQWLLRHPTFLVLLPALVVIVALLLSPSSQLARSLPGLNKIKNLSNSSKAPHPSPNANMPKAPVYFFSHGGASAAYSFPLSSLFSHTDTVTA